MMNPSQLDLRVGIRLCVAVWAPVGIRIPAVGAAAGIGLEVGPRLIRAGRPEGLCGDLGHIPGHETPKGSRIRPNPLGPKTAENARHHYRSEEFCY